MAISRNLSLVGCVGLLAAGLAVMQARTDGLASTSEPAARPAAQPVPTFDDLAVELENTPENEPMVPRMPDSEKFHGQDLESTLPNPRWWEGSEPVQKREQWELDD